MIRWIAANWFWIALWWAVWSYVFLTWYEKQTIDGHKSKVSLFEALLMCFFAGFGPFLAILIIIGKGIKKANEQDDEK